MSTLSKCLALASSVGTDEYRQKYVVDVRREMELANVGDDMDIVLLSLYLSEAGSTMDMYSMHSSIEKKLSIVNTGGSA